MVNLQRVKKSDWDVKALGPGLVGVFVGGTSGIGESTARAFAQCAISPRIYLVGRNKEQASRIQAEIRALNPSSQVKFVQSDDITLLTNVDKACAEIQAAEKQVNLLFMTAGFLTLAGRTETTEGLDKKLNMNYYSRLRFIQNLLPQLTAAAESGSLSRCVSVLAAGHESNIILDDLSLKTHYSASNALKHAATMNSLMAMYLARLHPRTSFVHTSPGVVKTNMLRNMAFQNGLQRRYSSCSRRFVLISRSREKDICMLPRVAIFRRRRKQLAPELICWTEIILQLGI